MNKIVSIFKCIVFLSFSAMLYHNVVLNATNAIIYLISLLLCALIQSYLHEFGHLFGGVISGYKLLQLRLNPIVISKTQQGKYNLKFEFSKFNQCIMVQNENERYFSYNAFGIILNALITITLIVVCLTRYTTFSDTKAIVYLAAITVGINKIVSNALPMSKHGYPNDMKIIMIISKSQLAKKHYFMYLSTYEKSFFNFPLDPDIKEEIKQEIESYKDSFFAEQTIKLYDN